MEALDEVLKTWRLFPSQNHNPKTAALETIHCDKETKMVTDN